MSHELFASQLISMIAIQSVSRPACRLSLLCGRLLRPREEPIKESPPAPTKITGRSRHPQANYALQCDAAPNERGAQSPVLKSSKSIDGTRRSIQVLQTSHALALATRLDEQAFWSVWSSPRAGQEGGQRRRSQSVPILSASIAVHERPGVQIRGAHLLYPRSCYPLVLDHDVSSDMSRCCTTHTLIKSSQESCVRNTCQTPRALLLDAENRSA